MIKAHKNGPNWILLIETRISDLIDGKNIPTIIVANSTFLRGRSGIKLTLHNFSNSLLKRCPWRQVLLLVLVCVNFKMFLKNPATIIKVTIVGNESEDDIASDLECTDDDGQDFEVVERTVPNRFSSKEPRKRRNFRTLWIYVHCTYFLRSYCTEEATSFWLLLLEKQF